MRTVNVTRTVNAYGAVSATDPLEPVTIPRRDLGPREVCSSTILG